VKFILTAVLFLGIPFAQGQSLDTEHWNISSVQLIAVNEINGPNRVSLANNSGLIEVTGNVSYLPDRGTGIFTPLPAIKLVGAAGPNAFSVAPIAVGMNSPSGCHYFYFTDTLANAAAVPAATRLDVSDGKVRFTGDRAVSLCFAFSTPQSPERMHLEFSAVSVVPEILTVRRPVIVGPPSGNVSSVVAPKCMTVEPNYPIEARKAHIQGAVTLDVVIHSDGTIEVKDVLSSLGYGLDEEAIAVMTKWKCTPGTVNGQPANIRLKITINFHLVSQN